MTTAVARRMSDTMVKILTARIAASVLVVKHVRPLQSDLVQEIHLE